MLPIVSVEQQDQLERSTKRLLTVPLSPGYQATFDDLRNRDSKLREPCVLVNVTTLELNFAIDDLKETAALEYKTLAVWRMIAQLT